MSRRAGWLLLVSTAVQWLACFSVDVGSDMPADAGGKAIVGLDGAQRDASPDRDNPGADANTSVPEDGGGEIPKPVPQTGNFRYGEALQKSFLFYEVQRSGKMPANNRIAWRGDSALKDGSDVSRDLAGGYYDAGDHVKFGLPGNSFLTTIAWGAIEYAEGYRRSRQLEHVEAALRWGCDFILKSQVTDSAGKTTEFYGQIGSGGPDHLYWGPPEGMTMDRPSYKVTASRPGSDVAGEAAAALAASALVFKSRDSAYAARLVTAARSLYAFADAHRGKYSDVITDAQKFYSSGGFMDELVWGALWLFRATGEQAYLDKAKQYFGQISVPHNTDWDNKSLGSAVLLAQLTGDARAKGDAEARLKDWALGTGPVKKSSGGLSVLISWGSLRYASNAAFLAGIYADRVGDPNKTFSGFAETNTNYVLGKNPRNSSYIVGFGKNAPKNPHHRGASGVTKEQYPDRSIPNVHLLIGAMVGGPGSTNDFDYVDYRDDYQRNEVAVDYNAGITGLLARMYGIYGGEPLTNAELDALAEIVIR